MEVERWFWAFWDTSGYQRFPRAATVPLQWAVRSKIPRANLLPGYVPTLLPNSQSDVAKPERFLASCDISKKYPFPFPNQPLSTNLPRHMFTFLSRGLAKFLHPLAAAHLVLRQNVCAWLSQHGDGTFEVRIALGKNWATKKTLSIGILIMVYYNPYIPG